MVENEIYSVVDGEDEEKFFTGIWAGFKEVKKFFQEAAEEGENIVTFIA